MSPQRNPEINRRTLLGSVGLAAGAVATAPLLSSCSAPSSGPAANSSPAASLGATPSKPVTLNILDVAGNLALTKPAIEQFKSAHPEIVSNVTYSTGTAPQLPAKLKAEQAGGNVQTSLVLTGTDGLASGITDGLYINLKTYYDQFFPNLMSNYQTAAASMATLAQDQGIEIVWYPSGPLIEYNPATVKTVPATTDDLLAWAKANPGKYQYAQPRNSGPGRTWLMGLPYLLGDSDPTDPTNGWSKTWAYLTELNKYVDTYPSGTSATMKNIAAGTVDIIASTTGWYINGRAIGTVPKAIAVAKFQTFTWVTDAQFGVIPKGVSNDVLIANLNLLAYILTPTAQAVTYDQGYFYPGPAVKNVTISQAPASSQQVIQQYGVPDFDTWMTQYPMKNSLPATAQVTAFDLWDKNIGSTK
ncbi:extracellular solute-binding protein [Actinospica robiniae]|uniref:extracellular solute-binding protein n=1 Tax=Actinospica robiniae TaxID=304901 RepID=UPI0003F7E21C|nr:extracellular solute-binding protein [Actinospica robiniae]